MKIRGKSSDKNEKIELQMTPMIDIVFQLLVFFIMTFNVVAQEGDFNIRMPAIGAPQDQLEDIEKQTLKVRMRADAAGNLKELKLDDAVLTTGGNPFANLHNRILSKVQDAGGPDEAANLLEVEFECDYDLKYNNVIEAITAVSGSRARDSDKISKLIENIKFAEPKKKPGS